MRPQRPQRQSQRSREVFDGVEMASFESKRWHDVASDDSSHQGIEYRKQRHDTRPVGQAAHHQRPTFNPVACTTGIHQSLPGGSKWRGRREWNMPIDYARRLTGKSRTATGNRQLGWALAFIAGATNAGAFLAVRQYTSHMTGIVSSMADSLVLGQFRTAAAALGALLSFLLGAAVSAVLVNYARRRQLQSEFALPLLLEAGLLLVFGLLGAWLSEIHSLFVSVTVMLLCFMMGLQNAVITKVSRSVIRTTHVTGVVTDIGIELGKLLYWNRLQTDPSLRVTADRDRLTVLSLLMLSFFSGGVIGALGFQLIGYAMTVPLAVILIILAGVPAADDIRAYLGKNDS